MGTVNTSVSGTNVTISVRMNVGEAPRGWWIRVTSKYDYGYGKGQGVGDYPWIVEIIDRTGTTDTSYSATKTYKPGLYVAELNVMGVGPIDFSTFELVAPVAKPTIFNWCWKVGTVAGGCSAPRVAPPVPAGSAFTLETDVFNTGSEGKVRTVFKVDGAQVSSQDKTMTSMTMWNVTATATMPNKNVGIAIEVYALSGTTWALIETKNDIVSLTAPACSTVSLDPYSAKVNPADTTTHKVILTATAKPTGTSFPIIFKNESGTVLGTCNTDISTGKCTYTWDYNIQKNTAPDTSYSDGTSGYFITAAVGTPGSVAACTSTRMTITVGSPIVQHTITIVVKDANTGSLVSGASVLVANYGTRVTDVSGKVSFLVDDGTVGIVISKTGYNNTTDAQSVYVDRTLTYSFIPTPVVPTPGSVQFVSVPSAASIYLDGTDTGEKTPKTISGISSGYHTFTFKLSGYNDSSGEVTVLSGSTVQAYLSMTALTPTVGALNITSHPVMDAEVFIDGIDQKVTSSGATIIHDIPPGSHMYALKLAGYEDSSGTFNISAGITTFIDALMIPLVTIGTVEIKSTPAGAKVYIDDIDINKATPVSITQLDVGSHTYKLVLSGYLDGFGNFDVVSGEVTPVDVILTAIAPTTGILSIISNPPNAKVFIDGTDINKVTPATIKDLTPESHTYLLKLEGYKDFGGLVTITEGWTKTVSAALERIAGPAKEGVGMGAVLLGVGALAAIALASRK